MQPIRKMKPFAVLAALPTLNEEGIDTNALLRQVGLNETNMHQQDARISFIRAAEFFELAATELNDPFFGMRVGEQCEPGTAGPWLYLGKAAKTFGDLLSLLTRYTILFDEAWIIETTKRGGEAIIERTPAQESFLHYRQIAEFGNHITMRIFDSVTESYVQFIYAGSPYSPIGSEGEYDEWLGCPARFNCDKFEIVLPASLLDEPLPAGDEQLWPVVTRHYDEMLENHLKMQNAFLVEAEKKIIERIPYGQAKLEIIAKDMAVSKRTFLRRLNDEAITFSGLLRRVRHDLALRYLKQSELSLTEISFNLGYSGLNAFSAAFKRWTGKSPKAYRIS